MNIKKSLTKQFSYHVIDYELSIHFCVYIYCISSFDRNDDDATGTRQIHNIIIHVDNNNDDDYRLFHMIRGFRQFLIIIKFHSIKLQNKGRFSSNFAPCLFSLFLHISHNEKYNSTKSAPLFLLLHFYYDFLNLILFSMFC